MAIELAYMNLVIPIEKIEEKYPGGFQQYKKDKEMRHDDYLVVKSAMSMDAINTFVIECEAFGLVGVIEENGVKKALDFCIVDLVPTLPCDWMEFDGTSVYHQKEWGKNASQL